MKKLARVVVRDYYIMYDEIDDISYGCVYDVVAGFLERNYKKLSNNDYEIAISFESDHFSEITRALVDFGWNTTGIGMIDPITDAAIFVKH